MAGKGHVKKGWSARNFLKAGSLREQQHSEHSERNCPPLLSLSIAFDVLLVFFLFSIVFVAGVLLLFVCFAFCCCCCCWSC